MPVNNLGNRKPIALYTQIYSFVYTMDIRKIKRKNGNHSKSVLITIRVTPAISEWLKEKDYSPTRIFYEALRVLGYEEEK